MGRRVAESRRSAWRRRLAGFPRSGLTVAAYCRREGVSVPLFYAWKRRLADEMPADGGEVHSKARAAKSAEAFLPVRIADGAVVEIEGPAGLRIRVPSRDLEAVAAAIAAAGRMAVEEARRW